MSHCAKGGEITAPKLKPAMLIPMAIPFFLANHLGIVDITGAKQQLAPIPIKNPQIKYTSHNELIRDNNKNPIAVNRP